MDETLDDLFSIFDGLDGVVDFPPFTPLEEPNGEDQAGTGGVRPGRESQKSSSSSPLGDYSETEVEPWPKSKRVKLTASAASSEETGQDGQPRVSHITVERNRRKQMNEHLSVLRSLMPCFYVKRGDQASIIGGVVDYINELQQILQSLEAKKQRKVCYNEVLSPRKVSSSPRHSPLSPRKPPPSPRKPPLSPRLSTLPVSPRTPQSRLHQPSYNPATSSASPSSSSSNNSSSNNVVDTMVHNVNELVANSKSAVADVEVKFSGPNLLLKTVSPRIPGQALKIVAALEDLSLEILHANISTVEDAMLVNSFTIKIGIECQLSAEELAQQIQQTFC